MKKILITIWHDDVAPRFDLAAEVLIANVDVGGEIESRKTLVLPTVSAEDLCRHILSEGMDVVVCGAIELEYYQFLNWKGVKVLDSVIGPYEKALELARKGQLKEGAILFERKGAGKAGGGTAG